MAKIRVVGYARVSTKMQIAGKEFDSIDAQLSLIKEYVRNHSDLELVGTFTDPGKSGKNMHRPGMEALIERVKTGDIRCVLSYRLDRISRDNFDYFIFEREMEHLNVRVLYTNDMNPDNSPIGKFIRMLMVALAQLERNQTVQRIVDKHIELLKQGYHAGGYPPLGYLSGDKKNTVDPVASLHVKEIFAQYLKGKKPSEIAAYMLAKYVQIPIRQTRNGKKFGGQLYTENHIRKILENPVYAGYVHRKKGTELYEGLHTAIVSRKDWEKVQEKIKHPSENAMPPIRMRRSYLLKGKLLCDCGAMMTAGASGKKVRDKNFYYYICSGRNRERRGRPCKTSIATVILESVLFATIGKIVTKNITPALVKKNSEKYETALYSEKDALSEKRNHLNGQLKIMVDRFAKIGGNDVLQKALSAELKKASDELASMDRRMEEIDAEIELFEKRINLSDMQTNALMQNLDALQAGLTDSEKRKIVKDAIERLTLSSKVKDRFIRTLTLKVVSTPKYSEQLGVLKIVFEVNTHRGRSEWRTISPFEIRSENFDSCMKKTDKRMYRHWLHDVMKWQAEIQTALCKSKLRRVKS